MVASAAILMAVNPRVPGATIRASSRPPRPEPQAIASTGSAGAGTVFHLTGELFKQLAGLPLQHVPYRGGSSDRDRAPRGRIPLAFETMLAASHVRAGALRARGHQPAAQRHHAGDSHHRRGPAPAAGRRQLLRPVRARRHPGADPDAAARCHDRGAGLAGCARAPAQAGQVVGGSPAELAAYVAAEIEMGYVGAASGREARLTGGAET